MHNRFRFVSLQIFPEQLSLCVWMWRYVNHVQAGKKSMSWKCSHLKWGCFCFHSNNQFPIIHHVVCSTHSPPCRMLVVATSWKSFIYYVCHDKTAGTKNYWFFAPGSFFTNPGRHEVSWRGEAGGKRDKRNESGLWWTHFNAWNSHD